MTHPTAAHIVKLMHQADGALAKGQSAEDFCRRKKISTATYYRWKRKYGGLSVNEAKRLKKIEAENTKLKKTPSASRRSCSPMTRSRNS